MTEFAEQARRPPGELLDEIEAVVRLRRSRTSARVGRHVRVAASPERWVRARPWATCGAAFLGGTLVACRGGGGHEDDGSSADDGSSTTRSVLSTLLALSAQTASRWLFQQLAAGDGDGAEVDPVVDG